MVNINLLPKEILEQQRLQNLIKLTIFISVFTTCVLAVIYILRLSYLNTLNLKSSKLEMEIRKLEPVLKEVKQLESVKATLQARKDLVENLLNNGLLYSRFMSRLLKLLPERVWFTELSTETVFTNDRRIKELKVSLNCSCYDKFSIADFLSNLEQSQNFKNVSLGPIEVAQQGKYELNNFKLEFIYSE
ncbi:MAG: PilN domain-containing protein [Endomicrobiia bacterium]